MVGKEMSHLFLLHLARPQMFARGGNIVVETNRIRTFQFFCMQLDAISRIKSIYRHAVSAPFVEHF